MKNWSRILGHMLLISLGIGILLYQWWLLPCKQRAQKFKRQTHALQRRYQHRKRVIKHYNSQHKGEHSTVKPNKTFRTWGWQRRINKAQKMGIILQRVSQQSTKRYLGRNWQIWSARLIGDYSELRRWLRWESRQKTRPAFIAFWSFERSWGGHLSLTLHYWVCNDIL